MMETKLSRWIKKEYFLMDTFTFIDQLILSKKEEYNLYEELRTAFEESHPNYSVEASDTCVLTVFPPQWDNETPDDDVVNYATGMFGQWPALSCMDDSRELLVLRDGRLETQCSQPASM